MIKPFSILFAAITIVIASCKPGDSKRPMTVSMETAIDTGAGSCPYLTKDNKNNIVLSWIKQVDTASFVYCFAVSEDQGKTFGKPIEIPGSKNVHPHGENMPKVIFKPSGEIIAAWAAANPNPINQFAGLVYYSQSFDDGKTWTKARSITDDKASFDQRYFDVALLPDGEAAIVWLDNRKRWDSEGSGLFYAVTKGNRGFQDERMISGPCCQCCRTDLYVDRKKNIHVLYRAIINDSIRDMVHIVSTDNGRLFNSPARISQDNWVISGCPHTGPAMAENKEGVHFTWFTGGSTPGIFYNKSTDNGKTFSARDSVSGSAAKHCQITSLPTDHIVIVWNESFSNGSKFNSRIGMEERDPVGNTIDKRYITSETGNASFPVIYLINENKAIIGYTENINDKDQVQYKQVSFNE